MTPTLNLIIVGLISLSIPLIGCTEKDNTTVDTALTYSVESGITGLSGVVDDHNDGSFALRKSTGFENIAENIQQMVLPQAYAANCLRAVNQTCSAGVKLASYSACTIPGSVASIDGSVNLTYSNAPDCSDNVAGSISVGQYVTRTYDYDISGPRGGILSVSSSAATDYRGNSISGGGRLSKTGASSWTIEVLGKNKALSLNGRTLFNHSVRTLSPVQVTGSLGRASRVMDGGQIEVIHNLAQFTATHTPNNLTWTSSCCHPVSGSLSTSLTGSLSGSATITFTGCGTATINTNDKTKDVTLSYCE